MEILQNQLGVLIEQSGHGGVVKYITEPSMNAKKATFDSYLTRTATIHDKLDWQQQLADDHFDHDPDVPPPT